MSQLLPTAEEVADVLDRAIELMNDTGKHWVQGRFQQCLDDPDEFAYCSVGAIRKAAGISNVDFNDNPVSSAAVAAVARAYLPITKDQLRDEWHSGTANVVMNWNDSNGTAWEQVVRRFKRARTRVLARAKKGLAMDAPVN